MAFGSSEGNLYMSYVFRPLFRLHSSYPGIQAKAMREDMVNIVDSLTPLVDHSPKYIPSSKEPINAFQYNMT